jgi:hypothetical protein
MGRHGERAADDNMVRLYAAIVFALDTEAALHTTDGAFLGQ